MIFDSYAFFVFFCLVGILYYWIPHKFRNPMLLLASCYFYMAFIPIYILILLLTVTVDYFGAIFIEESSGRKKKFWLSISIITTCLILFVFKYFNFFINSIEDVAAFFHLNYPLPLLKIILPIGLSFHTFQSLSYVIEVYRGEQKPERDFFTFFLYVMFFPQLVAGPIERPQNLLHQFHEVHDFDYKQVTNGLKLMAWGFIKKIVIADRLATFVNPVFDNPQQFSGISLMTASVFFSFQIYCDFSGYSDIAIGSAQTLGFKLMTNFNRPYFSKSISEFWRRWHISLSTWFKDYLYIPLGGNRAGQAKTYSNLFFTFLISGLWHGANWTYILWGALHGIYLILGLLTKNLREKIVKILSLGRFHRSLSLLNMLVTFVLVTIAWIFFRANTVHDAFYIITHLGKDFNLIPKHSLKETIVFLTTQFFIGKPKEEFFIAVLSIGALLSIQTFQGHKRIVEFVNGFSLISRWIIYFAAILTILIFSASGKQNFIYFQF